MADVIVIMGESGSGKSTSLRNLDPAATVIIDADKKGLPWRGWRRGYSKESGNYFACDDGKVVQAALRKVDKERPDVHVAVVDTINGIMVADERQRKDEKGYDKWADLAWAVYDLFDDALRMRDDLTVVFLAHTQTDADDFGYRNTHIKTSGRKLEKIVLESKVRTVLWARREGASYVFGINSPNSTAKVPMGLYEGVEAIGNDIARVIDDLRRYDAGEE